MKAKIQKLAEHYPLYIAFLAWSTLMVCTGIVLMTGTAIGVCTAAFK